MSPYGVAAGECVAHPPTHTLDRWERAAVAAAACTSLATENGSAGATATDKEAVVEAEAVVAASAAARRTKLLGGRVYRLTKLVEKPTAEFARENLVTPGLGTTAEGEGGEGRHLVVFGQYILPARRTFDILAEDIRLDRRERCVAVYVHVCAADSKALSRVCVRVQRRMPVSLGVYLRVLVACATPYLCFELAPGARLI